MQRSRGRLSLVSISLSFHLEVIINSIPWIDLSPPSFVSKFNKQARKRQLRFISLFIQFSSSAFPALLRLSDYLHSCLLYASNSGFITSKMESTLPSPRDGAIRSSPFPVVRECYDRIHPSLETEARDQYAGYVFIQNPSALLQLKNWDEADAVLGRRGPAGRPAPAQGAAGEGHAGGEGGRSCLPHRYTTSVYHIAIPPRYTTSLYCIGLSGACPTR